MEIVRPIAGVTVTGGEGKDGKRFFVAVHVGAGYHSPSNHKPLRSAMNRACLAAASVLQQEGSVLCLDAVVAAIQLLEVSYQFTRHNYSFYHFDVEFEQIVKNVKNVKNVRC